MKKVAIEIEYVKLSRPMAKPQELPLTVSFAPNAIKIFVDGHRPGKGSGLQQCEIRPTLTGIFNDLSEKVEDAVSTIKYFGWEGIVDMVKGQIFSEKDAPSFEGWIKKFIDALLSDYAERDFEIIFDGLNEDYEVLKKKFAEAERGGRLTAKVDLAFSFRRTLEELIVC